MRIYWVATYGDLGLQVDHFRSEKEYEDAVKDAKKEHREGKLDSYMHDEEET